MQRTVHEVLELRDLIVACDAVANKLLHAASTARDADVVQMLGAHQRTFQQQGHQLRLALKGEGGLYGLGAHPGGGTGAAGATGPGTFGPTGMAWGPGGPAGPAGPGPAGRPGDPAGNGWRPMRGGSPEVGPHGEGYDATRHALRADRPELVGWEPGAGNNEGWQAGARREPAGLAAGVGLGPGAGGRESGGLRDDAGLRQSAVTPPRAGWAAAASPVAPGSVTNFDHPGGGPAARTEARRPALGDAGRPAGTRTGAPAAEAFTAVRPVGYGPGSATRTVGGGIAARNEPAFRGHWAAQGGPEGGPGTEGVRFDSPRVGLRPELSPAPGTGPAAGPTPDGPRPASQQGPAHGQGQGHALGSGPGPRPGPGPAPFTGTAAGGGPAFTGTYGSPFRDSAPRAVPGAPADRGFGSGPSTAPAAGPTAPAQTWQAEPAQAAGVRLADPDTLAIADCLQDCKHMALRMMVAATEASDRHLRRTLYQMAGHHLEMAEQHSEWLRRRGLYTVPPATPDLVRHLEDDIRRMEEAVQVSPAVAAGTSGGAVHTSLAGYPAGGLKGAFGGQPIRN